MNRLSVFLLCLSSACSAAPISNFTRDIAGVYALNRNGAEFFAVQTPGLAIAEGTVFNVTAAGVITDANNRVTLTPREVRSSYAAVYLLNNNGRFVAVHLNEKRILLISTNSAASPSGVDFSFPVPIATKQ